MEKIKNGKIKFILSKSCALCNHGTLTGCLCYKHDIRFDPPNFPEISEMFAVYCKDWEEKKWKKSN